MRHITAIVSMKPDQLPNSISITPALSATGGRGAAAGSGVIATGLNAAGTCDRSQSCAIPCDKSKWYEPARRINPLLTLTTFLRFEVP
jgi:hypothetical protein